MQIMESLPFSIAMSVYSKDDASHFDRALQSITDDQTIPPNEIVLVCDGPIGESLEKVITKYTNKYPVFKIIRLDENQGLGNALRIAVEESSCDLIARMDSDDISVCDRFEQQLKCFEEHPEIDIVGGDIIEFIDNELNTVGKRTVPTSDSAIKQYMKKRAGFNHVTVMFKKQAVQSAGGYLDWFWNEDYYLWIRMQLNEAMFLNTGTILVKVRVDNETYRRRGGNRYFRSEYGLQKYMLKNGMISYKEFIGNVAKRIIVQMLLPNSIRGWVFRRFARSNS